MQFNLTSSRKNHFVLGAAISPVPDQRDYIRPCSSYRREKEELHTKSNSYNKTV